MFRLPRDIIKKIFEFDPTFRLCFNKVIKELEDCTPFFRVVTLTDIADEQLWQLRHHQPIYRYNLTFTGAKNLANYWNFEYLSDPSKGKWFIKWSKNYKPPPEFYKYIESELDISLTNLFPRILYNIKASRFINKRKIN